MSIKRLLPQGFQNGFIKLLKPLISFFIKYNFNPNTFTVLGLIFSVVGSVLLVLNNGYLKISGFLFLIGGLCDILDGQIARRADKVTRFGALFDSTIDRYSEVIMFFGIGSHYVANGHYLLSVITFLALGGSTMVSYIRARAESLGYSANIGIMQRPERIVLIGSGAALSYPLFHISILSINQQPVSLLELAIWLVAILANYTAIQRLIHIYKQDNE